VHKNDLIGIFSASISALLRCSMLLWLGPEFTGWVRIRFSRASCPHGEDEVMKAKATETALPGEATPAKVFDATMSSLKDGVAKATSGFEVTQTSMKEGMEKAMKTAEDFVAFGQGNMEAMMKSSQIWAAGVQDLSKHLAATAQATFDNTFSTFKTLSGVKSFKDAFEIQSSFARATIEKAMAESGKLTETSFKLTEQAMAPITARVTLAVEKFAKAA
jgi:phasin family protein